MPRIARIVAAGLPHHITQRGNYRQKVFTTDKDRQTYLSLISEYSEKYKVSIVAYCLMDNHVHFIAIPGDNDSLARTFNTAHMRYAQYVNNRLRATGHLWQGRFFSCVLDSHHLLAAARYVEMNPVRGKLVEAPWEWRWSSAEEHTAGGASGLKIGDLFSLVDFTREKWKTFLMEKESGAFIAELRKNTRVGKPSGSLPFIKELENRLDRKIVTRPRGRPKRTK